MSKQLLRQKEGLDPLVAQIEAHQLYAKDKAKRTWLLTEKAYQLIKIKRMKDVRKEELLMEVQKLEEGFNLYAFVEKFLER